MFVAVPNSIKNQIIDVSPVFWRIQAVVLTCKHSKILIKNSYFPVAKRTVNVHDVNELLETLEAIKHTIEVNEFNDILFLSDINADFLRNSNHCNQVSNFLVLEFQLNKSWDNFEIDITMCHEINDQFQVATLDHFFWNQHLEDKVLDAGVIHSPDNFSDHCPIYCIINDDIPGSSQIIQNYAPPKPKWKKATSEEKASFTEHLDEQLELINIPLSVLNCTDVHCKDDTHRTDSDTFMTSVLDTIDVTAYNCLPLSNPNAKSSKKIIPGWSEFVKPFRDKAFFWSQVWKSALSVTLYHEEIKEPLPLSC
jgi:hypothetical protein